MGIDNDKKNIELLEKSLKSARDGLTHEDVPALERARDRLKREVEVYEKLIAQARSRASHASNRSGKV